MKIGSLPLHYLCFLQWSQSPNFQEGSYVAEAGGKRSSLVNRSKQICTLWALVVTQMKYHLRDVARLDSSCHSHLSPSVSLPPVSHPVWDMVLPSVKLQQTQESYRKMKTSEVASCGWLSALEEELLRERKEQILSIDPYAPTPGTTQTSSTTSACDNTSEV